MRWGSPPDASASSSMAIRSRRRTIERLSAFQQGLQHIIEQCDVLRIEVPCLPEHAGKGRVCVFSLDILADKPSDRDLEVIRKLGDEVHRRVLGTVLLDLPDMGFRDPDGVGNLLT